LEATKSRSSPAPHPQALGAFQSLGAGARPWCMADNMKGMLAQMHAGAPPNKP
jgi:hypothetical protein